MILHVTKAEYRGDYRIWLSFNDGSSGEVDLEGKLAGPMFEPLTDLKAFLRFKVSRELRTIVWENGADLAPEYLHDLLVPSRARANSKSIGPGKGRRPGSDISRKHRAKVGPRPS